MKFLTYHFLFCNVFSSVCIQVFPQPPECLHKDKDNNNNLVIGIAAVVGGYYFLKGVSKPMDELDLTDNYLV